MDCYFWSFPYYLVGAGIAGLVGWLNRIVRMGNFATDRARGLPDLPLVPPLPGQARGRESGTSRRWPTCTCGPSKRWRWRSKPRTTPPTITCSGCACMPSKSPRNWASVRQETGSPARGGAAARYRQAGGAGTHHLEARPADAGRIREDEDPPAGGGGDSGARAVPVSGGADRAGAPREVGRLRLSLSD